MDEDSEVFDDGEGNEESSSTTTIISYHTEDFISKPTLSKDGTIPLNILEFHHSFGYDCRKRFNLCVADPDTLIFASGNLIHFFSVSDGKLAFRRCSTGGGIGHITKNPKYEHIAIGENGTDPPIIIYEWPSMEIVTVLNKGTTRSFSNLRYSPDGKQLVSQGGDPDYLITVWDWQQSKIALQCKSHGQDVFNVVFSQTMPGHMTSCGSGHIKCWKMSDTFTGLKLQGELGRFGKTEISDIIGVYPMPDEKIISGCEWGNILVWDEGLIKLEVRKKNRRPCHASYISQFEYINGELISVGTDGYINFWYYETIDQAEPSEDSHFVDVEPIYEFSIGGQADDDSSPKAMLLQIQKKEPNDTENNLWYAQDGNGGLWLVDLSTLQQPQPPSRLLTCHAGQIMDIDVADWSTYAASIGQDGSLHIYNYHAKKLIFTLDFHEPGTSLLWLPCVVEPSGSTIVCGFSSGVIRMVSLDMLHDEAKVHGSARLTQALKPHTMGITRMAINSTNELFVTGSEDNTIFVFHIEINDSYPKLVPIGYLEVASAVTFMTWKPNHRTTLFIGCLLGDCVQVDLPDKPQSYTTISYKLTECKPITFKFESVKSSILREAARLEFDRNRMLKIAEKMEELKQMKESNPGMEIDEDLFIEASLEEDCALPEIYIPEVPNAVLMAFYTTRDTVLLSMSGYDAGYTYEYSNPEAGKDTLHVSSDIVADCDQEIRACLFYKDRKYIVLGLSLGEIRVCKINHDNESDFSNYWTLPMHDNLNGCIPSMRLSYDKKMLLTCGYDGNIFSYVINDDKPLTDVEVPEVATVTKFPDIKVTDIEDSNYLSLEQVIVQAEENRIMTNAKDEKEKTLATLRQLTDEYAAILKRNESLPISQRLTDEELELDPRITADLDEQLQAEMDLVHKKLAYSVEKSKIRLKKLMDHFIEPITGLPFVVKRILKPDTRVYSLRELKLTGEYAVNGDTTYKSESGYDESGRLKKDEDENVSVHDSIRGDDNLNLEDEEEDDEIEGAQKIRGVESFLKGLSPRTVQFQLGDEINQMLKKYRSLKTKLEEQEYEWKMLQSERPDPKAVNPEDEKAIQHAKNTIGDYKLKASLTLDEGMEKRPTVQSKYKEIIECRRKIHFRRDDFNARLRDLRQKKVELRDEVAELTKKLKSIHTELPERWVKPLPTVPQFDEDVEFPEQYLEMESYTSLEQRVRDTKKKKQSLIVNLPVEDFDEEYEVLLLDETPFRPGKTWNLAVSDQMKKKLPEDMRAVKCTVPPDVLAALENLESTNSKLEREMKRVRAARKSHEQTEILGYIQKSYEAFDAELDELEKERLEIVHESVYMDLYLLTMHQELIILKRFEGMENELSNNVNVKLKSESLVVKKIDKLTARIEDKNQYIAKLQEKIKEIMARYINSIKEDKFYSFLKRIVKKKYKEPKQGDESSSSSSSESSSSEEEENEENANAADDAASDDSRNIGVLHLDETICPEECDRDLYDDAFAVRERRYDMEIRAKDELRSIEILQRQLDVEMKNLKDIDAQLQADRDKLNAFLREKQRQLNDIDVTVILKMHQLQCFTGNDEPVKIQNCIVFDKTRLSQLYARVGELQQETADQLTKYRNDKVHLHKMKADCESMKKELEVLKEQIKKEMEQKFGQQISLVTLYEAVLRRLIYDIKANTGSLIRFYDEKIKIVKSEYRQQLKMLKDLIQDNTEKLGFLTVLEEELLKLRRALSVKLVPEEEINRLETQYEADLNKLKAVLRNQEQQKAWIYNDIKALSNKSKTLVPLDQLKSKSEKSKRRPTLTLFDGAERDSVKFKLRAEEDSSAGNNEIRDFLMDDSDYFKKIIAIRHLLSQVVTIDETNTKATIDRMLKEITENLQKAGYCRDEIEKNISDIMNVTRDGQEISQATSKERIGSLSDLIYRYSTELREDAHMREIKLEVREQLNDLITSVGIEDDKTHVAHSIVSKMKATGSVNSALLYILQKVPLDADDDTKQALSRHVRKCLREIMKGIENRQADEMEQSESSYE